MQNSKTKKADELLMKLISKKKTPSVHYLFFNRDQVIHEFVDGLADRKTNRKADKHTTYNAFSMTKTFTALAVLQLAEKGLMSIDDSVKKHLPGFPYPSEITIRQLLSHSAGIPNPNPMSWIHLEEEHEEFDRDVFFEKIFQKHPKVRTAPNDKFAYSNLGYVLLGQLIEKVSGQRYEDYVTQNIIKPLGLTPNDLGFEFTDNHAIGYQKKYSVLNFLLGFFINQAKYMDETENGWSSYRKIFMNGAAYGGLMGKPAAFMRYIRELLQTNCALLSEEFKKMLFTENRTNANRATGMCLSWFKGDLNRTEYHTHTGGGGGYYCEMRIYPEIEKGSVIMFNRTGVKDEQFLNKLDRFFLN